MGSIIEFRGLVKNLWWKYMPGIVVTVKWPRGWTEPDKLGVQTESTDPNDHYRPWLEATVGRQGWDWDWKIGPVTRIEFFNSNDAYDFESLGDKLEIKFRKGKEKYATMFALRWK